METLRTKDSHTLTCKILP